MTVNINLFGEQEPAKQIAVHKRRHKKTCTLFDYFNLDIFNNIVDVTTQDMPVLKPFNGYIPNRMVAFDEAFTKNDTDCIVHFYEDDRRFMRIFRNPDKYMGFFSKCALVIEPDLSQYADMPYPIRQANAYLNRAMAAYMQQNGVNVVPNITWSLSDSYQYSIAGRPQNSVIAVNCTGILGHDMSMYLWREGYKNVVKPLSPTKIIRYGDVMPDEMTDISIYFPNERINRLRHGS